jgi:DNA-binding response OmpR family regulator
MPAQPAQNNSSPLICLQRDNGPLAMMNILIIDDDAANVALLEAILQDAGYQCVKSITDSRLALDACENFQPDLVLLDLMMPHVDGFTILESLRFEAGAILLPIVILTADTNMESRLRAMRAGATDFLLKPLDHAEVLLRVANILESRRLQRVVDKERSACQSARAQADKFRSALWELENARSACFVL